MPFDYLGDSRLKHHIVFRRDTYMECVYCGKPADTREHIPSKVFLRKPLPANLPLVPACKSCNNGFSGDELFTALFVELLRYYCFEEYDLSEATQSRLAERPEGKAAYLALGLLKKTNYHIVDDRIVRIICKLAICHATHDLSEGFYCDSWHGKAENIYCFTRPQLSEDDLFEWDTFESMDGKLLPEVGSMGYEHILILGNPLANNESERGAVVLDWNDIQNDFYRYMCFTIGNEIHVKIVIGEVLFCHVLLRQNLE